MKKLYTGTGDKGSTGLLGEQRVDKFDLRMEALGTLDELSAVLGIARSMLTDPQDRQKIILYQRELYQLMAEVAASPENREKFTKINEQSVKSLEAEIDRISMRVETPAGFILPGETPTSAYIALARTITRRAERRVAELTSRGDLTNAYVLIYLNRLSSLFFAMELDLIQRETSHKPTMARESST